MSTSSVAPLGSHPYARAAVSMTADRKETTMKKDAKDKKKPFFARYLEGQELEDVTGGAVATTKYPSDRDEYHTMKYPSDDDEGGVPL
jgi:hypothetical protein